MTANRRTNRLSMESARLRIEVRWALQVLRPGMVVLIVAALGVMQAAAESLTIDFERLPDGRLTSQDMLITNEFLDRYDWKGARFLRLMLDFLSFNPPGGHCGHQAGEPASKHKRQELEPLRGRCGALISVGHGFLPCGHGHSCFGCGSQ